MKTTSDLVSPQCDLFYNPMDSARCDDFLTLALRDARRRIPKCRVSPELDIGRFRQALSDFDFQTPRPLPALLSWVIEHLESSIVQLTHPRYFGLFNPCPTFPAECADRVVAAFNPQLATATTSPVPIEIEADVIRSIAHRAGFPPDSSGHFTTGGTEANFTALVCTLTKANPRFGEDGISAFADRPTIYVSEDAHLAWYKIAHLFLSLVAGGWKGYASHVERAIELAQLLKSELIAREWTIVNSSPLAVVCAVPPRGRPTHRIIAGHVVAPGHARF